MCLTEMLSSLSSWIRPSSLIQEEMRKASSFSMLAHSDILLSASCSPFVMKSTTRKPGVEAGRTKTPSSLIIIELESLSANTLKRLMSVGQQEGRDRLRNIKSLIVKCQVYFRNLQNTLKAPKSIVLEVVGISSLYYPHLDMKSPTAVTSWRNLTLWFSTSTMVDGSFTTWTPIQNNWNGGDG